MTKKPKARKKEVILAPMSEETKVMIEKAIKKKTRNRITVKKMKD